MADNGFLFYDFWMQILGLFECYTTEVARKVGDLFTAVHEIENREYRKLKTLIFQLKVSIPVTKAL